MAGGQADLPAVRFNHISKRFPLDPQRGRTLMDLGKRLVGRREEPAYFWPLKDVSFEIATGRAVGVIGENGAGKSTLLKLITRILQPTEGTIDVNGRVSALLELGAGFHPELTGRENVYLNGSILGLRRATVDRVYDRVISFADIGPFIDAPVKNYSSGMYARLGFAIAINVDPDILLIDEVLAVGDEEFQRRCLDAIKQLRARGKTIIMISHSLGQIESLCDEALWLHDNCIEACGPVRDVVHSYLEWVDAEQARRLLAQQGGSDLQLNASGSEQMPPPPRRWGAGPIRITSVQMRDEQGRASWSFKPLDRVVIEIEYEANAAVAEPVFSALIHKPDGHYVWASNTLDEPVEPIRGPGKGQLRLEVTGLALTAGRYHLSAAAYAFLDPPYWSKPSDFHEWLYNFQVLSPTEIHGDVVMPSRWGHSPPGNGRSDATAADVSGNWKGTSDR